MRILLIEDDRLIGDGLVEALNGLVFPHSPYVTARAAFYFGCGA